MSTGRPASRWFTPGSRLGADSLVAVDFQMHTRWTDGESTVREMLDAARAGGLDAIAITEHVNATSNWFPAFAREVMAQRRQYDPLDVFIGAEIAAADYDGRLKADPPAETELVLGVVHRYPHPAGGFWRFEELSAEDAVDLELRALIGLARNPRVHVLGHPGGTTFKKFGPFPVEWLEPAFVEARNHGVAVELNTKYLWNPDAMLALLRRVNPMISLGSDAHRAADVGSTYAFLRRRFSGTALQHSA
jgi:putative hydrolase